MEEMKNKYWAVDRDSVLKIVEEAYDELTHRITTMHSFTSAYGYDLNELGRLARTLQELEIRPAEIKEFNTNTRLLYKVFAEHLLKEAGVTIEDSVKSSTELVNRIDDGQRYADSPFQGVEKPDNKSALVMSVKAGESNE